MQGTIRLDFVELYEGLPETSNHINTEEAKTVIKVQDGTRKYLQLIILVTFLEGDCETTAWRGAHGFCNSLLMPYRRILILRLFI